MDFCIKAEDACILRSFLKEKLGLSSRAIIALKARENGILLNGAPVTVRAMLKGGDTLSLALADEQANQNLIPVPLPLSLLYEDDAITLCNKPADMPTHPSHGHFEDTLANALAYRYRDVPYVFRAVTRLDRETSGVVLTARNAHVAHLLSQEMERGCLQKSYFALVNGITPTQGVINLPIRRKPNSVLLREIHESGAPSITRYRRLFAKNGYSLVAVFPKTGRTHQIRLHFSAVGFPLCGDALYGREHDDFPRTMLHAARLCFPHPMTGDLLSVFAPLPEDFTLALSRLSFAFPTEKDAIPDQPCRATLP